MKPHGRSHAITSARSCSLCGRYLPSRLPLGALRAQTGCPLCRQTRTARPISRAGQTASASSCWAGRLCLTRERAQQRPSATARWARCSSRRPEELVKLVLEVWEVALRLTARREARPVGLPARLAHLACLPALPRRAGRADHVLFVLLALAGTCTQQCCRRATRQPLVCVDTCRYLPEVRPEECPEGCQHLPEVCPSWHWTCQAQPEYSDRVVREGNGG
jgi:hypothetical protein